MKEIGTKIYYCMYTGNVLLTLGDMKGYVEETTIEQDIEIYPILKNRDRNSVGVLKFEYGKYNEMSLGSTGARVDLSSNKLVFTYIK